MAKEADKPKYERVTLDEAEKGWKDAAAKADEREPEAIDWKKVEKAKVQAMGKDEFSKHVGDRFTVEHEGREIEVKLGSVLHLGDPVDLGEGSPGTQTQFALVFEPSEPLPEGTYRVRHDKLGDLDVHLEPVKSGDEEHLEAVFS